MPYNDISQLPEYIKKYPEKIQRNWMYVFNSVFNKTNSEERAFKAANAVIGTRLESKNQYDNHTLFIYQIDKYFGVMGEKNNK
jgi:cation transport regulator ChaB